MRDASLERTSYGSLLDSPAFGALRDRGTTRRQTIPRQGSGRRVSSRLAVTRTVTAGGHPLCARRRVPLGQAATRFNSASTPFSVPASPSNFVSALPFRLSNSRRNPIARWANRTRLPLTLTAARIPRGRGEKRGDEGTGRTSRDDGDVSTRIFPPSPSPYVAASPTSTWSTPFEGGKVALNRRTMDPTGRDSKVQLRRPSCQTGCKDEDTKTIVSGIETTTDTLCATAVPRFVTLTRYVTGFPGTMADSGALSCTSISGSSTTEAGT